MTQAINTEDNLKPVSANPKRLAALLKKREQERVRQAKSRLNVTRGGFKTVRENIALATVAKMDWACAIRGGCRGAYGRGEYLSLLIEKDVKRLKNQLSRLGECGECLKPLPLGCGGTLKGRPSCFKTQGERALRLKV